MLQLRATKFSASPRLRVKKENLIVLDALRRHESQPV